MEPSPHDSTRSSPKTKNNNAIDTPRTSNLKFLRSKRLQYFSEKISQNPISKREQSENVRKTVRTQTPRRGLSAPTSLPITADSDVPDETKAEAKKTSPNGETSVQATEEAKLPASPSPQDVQVNPGEEHLTDISAHHSLHLPRTAMETKENTPYRNLQTAVEKSRGPKKSIPSSLQPKISNPPVPSIHHIPQPVTKKNTKDILPPQGPQAVLEKSGGKMLFADPILQSSHTEAEGEESPTYHDPPSTPKQVKDKKYLPLSQMRPESLEVDVLSTHRSLLRSSFVTDLDQDLLEDFSVPESEKLHHVMTWAKKFLDKCNERESISASGDVLSKNIDEDTSFESIESSRVTDNYQSLLLKSPGRLYRPKLKRKDGQLDFFVAEPVSYSCHGDHEEHEDRSLYPQLVKNSEVKETFDVKAYADLGEQFSENTKQGYSDRDDIFGSRAKPTHHNYHTRIIRDTKPDMAFKENSINREDDSSSSESCLNTERLNSLLEDFDLIEKGLEKTGGKDGARTDRTYLVRKKSISDESPYISASGKIADRTLPTLHRVDSDRSLSEGNTKKRHEVCRTCNFSNTTSSNWCAECGSALNWAMDRPVGNNRTCELPNPHVLDDNVAEEFFSANTNRKSGDNSRMSKQKEKLDRTVCWEDTSDVSDGEGSVLEKYLFYVKQLDLIKSQEKEEETKHYQCEYNSETSSEEESSEDYAMPRVGGRAKPWGEAKTLGHKTIKEKSLNRTEGSNRKGLLDRKLQKSPNIPSKVSGPQRYWEKSSIAWSSYTHGELKPRSQASIQRPTSADAEKNKDELQGDKVTEIKASNKMERIIHGESNCVDNTNEYKNVAAAYMKTSNAWAVSEHLCKDRWERSTHNHQSICQAVDGSMWLLLPDELWIYIFSLLSHGDLSKVAQVCQRFRYIANDDSLWKVVKVLNCHSLKDSCLVSMGLHHPESISLYRCHDDTQSITDAGFGQLFQHCKDSLKKLNITNCSGEIFKGDAILFHVSNYCTRLTSVDISWTGATDKGIISLVQACACLQSLSTNGCNITDDAITALLKRHSKSLIKLEIFGCHALTAKCLISVATECVHLENLNIGRIPKATDVCLTKIASNLHKIATLNLTGLNVVRDRAVHHIVKQCSKLETLTLSSCIQVTDVSLVEISTYRTTIKYLDISGCKKVSDIGIQALARSCQLLRYLDLSSTGTGKRGVCLLASYCYATLECLKLSFCKEITADAIEKLCKNCKRLKVLHLYGCRVSPDLGFIQKFSKSFQILHDLSIPTANILGE